MELKISKLRIVILGIWALFMGKMGEIPQSISILLLMMVIDQVSGILAAKREALEHPGEKKYGISSKRMVLGIFKKAGYILTIVVTTMVTTMVDILMDTMMEYIGIKSTIKGSFCLLITVWFILGEAISILENASRMGVKVPRFFRKIISELQKDIDGKKS